MNNTDGNKIKATMSQSNGSKTLADIILSSENLNEEHKDDVDLIEATIKGNCEDIIAAFVRRQSFTVVDSNRNTVLHLAAKHGHQAVVRGLCALTTKHNLIKARNADGKTPEEMADSPAIKRDFAILRTSRHLPPTHNSTKNKKLADKKIRNANVNCKVLLALDGGGIRLVLESMILLEIERELQEPIANHVHWMGGTSGGGIVSSVIAVGIELEDAMRFYLTKRKIIFCGNTKIVPKHNVKGIESTLKSTFGEKTPLANIRNHNIMITASNITYAPPRLILFRSYAPRISKKEFEQLGYLDPERVLIWKALRSTSAAPIYFTSFNGLSDGAVFCNNPCITLLTDFFKLRKIENHRGIKNNDEIGCVISVGTGQEPLVPINTIDITLANSFALGGNLREVMGTAKNLFTLFMYQCTSSHGVHVGSSREWAHSLGIPFYRFSPKFTRAYELDTTTAEQIFAGMFETLVYIQEIKPEIVELCQLLKALPKNSIVHEFVRQ